MAISKTQNERPAIIALIDSANALEIASNLHAENIATLTEGLADEVSDRELAIAGVQSIIGEGFSEQLTIAQSVSGVQASVAALQTALNALSGALKIGATEEITVPANDSYSSSISYPQPFADTSKSFVVLGFADDLLQGTLELTLIDSTYSGFSYSITNTDADPANVTIGYLAVKVG